MPLRKSGIGTEKSLYILGYFRIVHQLNLNPVLFRDVPLTLRRTSGHAKLVVRPLLLCMGL